MAWVYDRENAAQYGAGDQGVRFWFDDKEADQRVAVVIGSPALQQLGGDGDHKHMLANFKAHEKRIVAGAFALLEREPIPQPPQALRMRFEDIPPA